MKWISTTDKLPAHNSVVLGVLNGEVRLVSLHRFEALAFEPFESYDYWYDDATPYEWHELQEVSHWMHIPKLPKN